MMPSRFTIVVFAFGLSVAGSVLAANPNSLPQILFLSDRDGSVRRLYVMAADGSNAHRVGALPGQYGCAQFSPDNKKILFEYSDAILSPSQIYLMNSDGSDPKAITSPPGSNSPCGFASDGRIVYFHELHPGSTTPPFTALYAMDMDGSNKTPFSINPSGQNQVNHVAMGPHGMIAFTSYDMVDNQFVEQIFRRDGGMAATRLTNSPEHFRFPGWCSSGGKIAYANTGGTTVQPYDHQHDGIYVMNADGSKPTRIVQIDFSRELANNGQSIIGAFSGGKTLVGVSGAPSFSPDCKMLTYSVNLSGRDQIYIVNADGTRLRQLTNTPGSNLCPSFSH